MFANHGLGIINFAYIISLSLMWRDEWLGVALGLDAQPKSIVAIAITIVRQNICLASTLIDMYISLPCLTNMHAQYN